MKALRWLGGWVLAGSLLDWSGAGSGRRGTPPATPPAPREHADDEHWRLTEREREIELRMMMPHWM